MRYSILGFKVTESLLLDAPYDSITDAKADLELGIGHNCPSCYGDPATCKQVFDALQIDNTNRARRGQLIGE